MVITLNERCNSDKSNLRKTLVVFLTMLLWILVIPESIYSQSAVQYPRVYTGDKTVQVGKSITLDPGYDVNFTKGGERIAWESLYISNDNAMVQYDTQKSKIEVTGLKPGLLEVNVKVVVNSTWYLATYLITVIDVTNIIIPSQLTLKLGETYTINPIISDPRASAYPLSWNSTNEKIASVIEGKITANESGDCTITCSYKGILSSCQVTVEPILLTLIDFDSDQIELNRFQKTKLEPIFKPENASNKEVSWKSSNSDVAIVNGKGEITAIGIGKSVIICMAKDGSEISGSFIIDVLNVEDTKRCMTISINDMASFQTFVNNGDSFSFNLTPISKEWEINEVTCNGQNITDEIINVSST